jgi:hypothetical protein
VPLAPAQVHALEHLGPVGRLGAAGAGADRDDGVLRVELAREQQQGALALELDAQGVALAGDLGLGLTVGRVAQELKELKEVGGALLERAPELDLLPQSLGLADDLLRGALVVPEPGLAGARVEGRDALFLGGEVKDAPTSTGCARPGREWTQGPLRAHLEVGEQHRPELDQPKGSLAPGDDGVHAGAVAIVGADAAVAVTVEGGGIAAGPAVTFASDEIHELGFFSLLHSSLTLALRGRSNGTGRNLRRSGSRLGWNGSGAVPGLAKNVLASIGEPLAYSKGGGWIPCPKTRDGCG